MKKIQKAEGEQNLEIVDLRSGYYYKFEEWIKKHTVPTYKDEAMNEDLYRISLHEESEELDMPKEHRGFSIQMETENPNAGYFRFII